LTDACLFKFNQDCSITIPILAIANSLIWFCVNSPGSAPYLYYDEKQKKYNGVVTDFFHQLIEDKLLEIEYLDSNRIRSEKFLYEGTADIFLSSRSWLSNPEKVLISDSLLAHRSFLYGMNEFPSDFELRNLSKKRICTRRGYHYPVLEPLFASKALARADSSSQSTMIDMLIRGRCDYAIFNEHNASYLILSDKFCDRKFFKSPQAISSVDIAFILGAELVASLQLINQHLKSFKANNQQQRSLAFHTLQKKPNC
jgi:polar amino acid transport system substrate-binding protein